MPKTKKVKKVQRKTKALAKKGGDKELSFAGSSRLLSEVATPKEKKERKMILAVSKALNISPLSVAVLGNMPYVDNKGRKEKIEQYQPGAQFEYNWIKRSENDTDKAICEARLVIGGKPVKVAGMEMPWIVGECSPASLGMSTLAGYQNLMAQTRAENRVFEYLYALRLRKELFEGLEKMMSQGSVDETTAGRALQAAETSPESMPYENEAAVAPRVSESHKSELLQAAKAKIAACKNPALLKQWRKGIKESTSYTDQEKYDLTYMINQKLGVAI